MCDYITTRAVYPDYFKEEIKEQPKVKQAIECVTYLAWQIAKKDKEL